MKKQFHNRFIKCSSVALMICCLSSACGPSKPKLESYQKERKPLEKKHIETVKRAEIRNDLIKFGREYLGCKYKIAGKDKAGFDCSGFVGFVFHAFKIPMAPSAHQQAELGKKIDLNIAKSGDLVFFGSESQITHVGIITLNKRDNLSIIHSSSSKGVIEENILLSDYWMKRIQKVVSLNSYLNTNEISLRN